MRRGSATGTFEAAACHFRQRAGWERPAYTKYECLGQASVAALRSHGEESRRRLATAIASTTYGIRLLMVQRPRRRGGWMEGSVRVRVPVSQTAAALPSNPRAHVCRNIKGRAGKCKTGGQPGDGLQRLMQTFLDGTWGVHVHVTTPWPSITASTSSTRQEATSRDTQSADCIIFFSILSKLHVSPSPLPLHSGTSPSNLGILLKGANEAARRAVVALAAAGLVELLKDLLGQHLAQLDAPLVEAVDVPDGALGKRQVLVVDNQGTKLRRPNGASHKDRRRRPVAEEALVGHEIARRPLGLDLVISLADHEGLGLGKVVGGEHLLVKVVGRGVVRLRGEDEVGRDQLGALVHKLEERVLGVGAGLAKENGALPVSNARLHGARRVAHGTGKRHDGMGQRAEEVYLPVVYLTDDPSDEIDLPLDSIESCCR
ncbi:hypothetical protein G6O67_006134 [Ophiocordyceps sinensis]|uniref:Uncharacterized protein n=1 Tax=Ophiocordyceps sinensis TaxID=72228 RepID=A0A8H4PMP5_9HYPO|nr:hypothetical protein G6O67_006134 [Ophiocordyceps sinensis]